jgi:O-methyltransferase domain/Dimerisation domain
MDFEFNKLNQIAFGYWHSNTFFALSDLGVFEFLGEGSHMIGEIAGACHFEVDAGRSLLNAGVALSLLKLATVGNFSNSPMALRFMTSGSKEALTNWVGVMGIWAKPWLTIADAIRTGRSVEPQGPVISADPDYTTKFILGMHEYASRGSDDIAAAVDLSEARTMVDVGGGAGTYSIAFCKRNPGLRSVIMDLPEVLEIADRMASEAGLRDRIELRSIDYRSSGFGTNVDCVLFSNVLHQESREVGRDMLERARAALSPGGKVLVHGHFLTEDRTGPVFATLHNLSARIIWDGGHSYTIDEMKSLMAEAGFESLDVAATPSGATKAILGRKPS